MSSRRETVFEILKDFKIVNLSSSQQRSPGIIFSEGEQGVVRERRTKGMGIGMATWELGSRM